MKPVHILIVEDNVMMSAAIEETLLGAGFSISGIARTYEEAVRVVKYKMVNLAIIDVILGEEVRDGVTTAEALLQYQWIPLIYLTGTTDDKTFERAKATNPFAFLNKPFRTKELVQQVQLALHHFQHSNIPNATANTEPLFWPTELGYARVEPADICYLEAAGNFTTVYLTNEAAARIMPKGKQEQPLMLTGNLGYWGKDLPPQTFYRLSKSLIVNLTHIDRIETNQLIMGMHSIPLTDGNRKTLMSRLRVVGTR